MSGRSWVRRPDGRMLLLHVVESVTEEPASFTCPRCGRTSHHPDDVRERYCGACHDWTGIP
jgi:ribosomal protein S27AE